MSDENADVEREIRAALQAQEYRRAATQALELYGPQILSFLAARLGSTSDAEEAFSMFAEDLWRGLPSFAYRCTVRGWSFALARNAANRFATAPARRAHRNVALTHEAVLGNLVDKLRSATVAYLRTEVKDAFRALRERLLPDDQTLLILHVDKQLPWREIAIVLNEASELPDDVELERAAARLRKRFERVKAELRAHAIEAGLLAR